MTDLRSLVQHLRIRAWLPTLQDFQALTPTLEDRTKVRKTKACAEASTVLSEICRFPFRTNAPKNVNAIFYKGPTEVKIVIL